jgi:metal-responsive CopG/Arc/MetJ family transcriptional regulator
MRDDLDVIDRLVDQLQAPSRSELIAAALTAHLQHERDVVG